jgi:hypothetical protein
MKNNGVKPPRRLERLLPIKTADQRVRISRQPSPKSADPALNASGPERRPEIRDFKQAVSAYTAESELLTALYFRYEKALREAYVQFAVQHSVTDKDFFGGLLLGFRRFAKAYSGDIYRFLHEVRINHEHMILFYQLGRLYDKEKELDPSVVSMAEKILAESLHALNQPKDGLLQKSPSVSQQIFLSSLVRELIDNFQAENETKIKTLTNVLKEIPQALPEILRAHARYHSPFRSLLVKVLGFFGFKVRDLASQVLNPLIKYLTQSREGENQVLNYVFAELSHDAEIYSRPPRDQLKQLKIPRGLALRVVQDILKNPEMRPQTRADKLRKNVVEIAAVNGLNAERLGFFSTKRAKTILFIAAKMLQVKELIEKRETVEALDRYRDLLDMDSSVSFHRLRIPKSAEISSSSGS